jgi:hypothetical protein
MKYCLLGLLLLAQNLYGQVVLPSLMDMKNLKPVQIKLDKKKRSEIPTLFTSIVLKDLRTDTVTMGYVRFGQELKTFFRLEMEQGTKEATVFLNKYFQTAPRSDSLRLVILLKNFFITQNYKMPSTGVNLVNDVYTSKVYVMAHLLLEKNDQSYLLGTVDTCYTLNKWLGRCYNTMAETGLIKLGEKAEDHFNEMHLTPYDPFAIQELYKTTLPPTGSLKDGFYASYQAFLTGQQNKLAVAFEQKKNARVLRTSSPADTAILTTCWGFVENGSLYVRHQNIFVPLLYNFGSWSGFGIDTYDVYKLPWVWSPVGFAIDLIDIGVNGPTSTFKPFKPYRLNAETGRLE